MQSVVPSSCLKLGDRGSSITVLVLLSVCVIIVRDFCSGVLGFEATYPKLPCLMPSDLWRWVLGERVGRTVNAKGWIPNLILR